MSENITLVVAVIALIVMLGGPLWLIREMRAQARTTPRKGDGPAEPQP